MDYLTDDKSSIHKTRFTKALYGASVGVSVGVSWVDFVYLMDGVLSLPYCLGFGLGVLSVQELKLFGSSQ